MLHEMAGSSPAMTASFEIVMRGLDPRISAKRNLR
jgi:hypothetical protein